MSQIFKVPFTGHELFTVQKFEFPKEKNAHFALRSRTNIKSFPIRGSLCR